MSREINELIADSRVAPLVKLYDARGDEIDRLRALNAELLAALKGAMFFVPIGTKAHEAGDAACDKASCA